MENARNELESWVAIKYVGSWLTLSRLPNLGRPWSVQFIQRTPIHMLGLLGILRSKKTRMDIAQQMAARVNFTARTRISPGYFFMRSDTDAAGGPRVSGLAC
jgi:hypothetical protein